MLECRPRSGNCPRKDKPGMFSMTVLATHAQKVSRCRLCISETYLTSRACFLKTKVKASLEDVPDEVKLLVNGEAMTDDEVLAKNGVSGESNRSFLALAVYNKPGSREWKWEEPWPGVDECFNSQQSGLRGLGVGVGTRWPEFLGVHLRGEVPTSLEVAESPPKPPPRKLDIAPKIAWTAEETRSVESGHLFKLALDCKIVAGKRCHQRVVSVPVSPLTSVGELEERLTEWLGSAPDEWLLMSGDTALARSGALAECHIEETSTLQVVAWYKHAV